MATWTGSTGVYWVAGVLGLLGAAGGLAYVLLQGEAGEDATVPVMPEAVILEDLTDGAEPAEPEDAAPEPVVPDFSNFRLQNGLALMAGTAEPGATLDILLDGEILAQAEVSSAGQYTAIFDIPPSAMPRILSFTAQLGEADPVPGARTVIIQPFGMPEPEPQAPEQVAEVDVTETQGDLDGGDAETTIVLSDRAPDVIGDVEVPEAAPAPVIALSDRAPDVIGDVEVPETAPAPVIALSDRAPDVIGDVEVPETAPAAPVIALSDRAPDVIGDVEVPETAPAAPVIALSDRAPDVIGDVEVPEETAPAAPVIALSDRAPDVIGDVEVPEETAPAPVIALSDRAPDAIGDVEVPEAAPAPVIALSDRARCDRGCRSAGNGSGGACDRAERPRARCDRGCRSA